VFFQKFFPADAILLVSHDTFGMDLAPGLSVKMDAAYAADIVDFEGLEGTSLKMIRQELATALKAVVSCSRPIVDAKWLEKSRQVGTSGQTVKPKVYLTMGISGAFQHMGGVKGNPFIVAINKNSKAPIFQVADVGILEDILEFMPELTEAISSL
jgi:electron transfer flavoprotein alpha subunit